MSVEVFSARAPWYLAGPAIGLVIVVLFWLTNKPLGALGGYIEFEEWAVRGRGRPGWRAYFLFGVSLGAVVSATVAAGWRPTLDYGTFDRIFSTLPLKAVVLALGEVLMGFGGRMAGGCTSGHGLCGTSLGSPASLVSTATFMTTAITVAFALAWTFGG
jgi:uncharacterized membrane protein YedE/YeeE